MCVTLFKYRHYLLTFLVYKEAGTLTSADKSLMCAIWMGAEEYHTTSSPSFLTRSIAQWEKKLRLACSAELRDWGTVHLHQFFSHFFFFYAREGRRIRGTACSLEHCFHLVPCEVFRLSSFFVDETLVFDHLLHSCRVTFYNAFWRFFFQCFLLS